MSSIKVVHRGPLYICDGCRSLLHVPDDCIQVYHGAKIYGDSHGMQTVRTTSKYFECPHCDYVTTLTVKTT